MSPWTLLETNLSGACKQHSPIVLYRSLGLLPSVSATRAQTVLLENYDWEDW